MIQTSRSTFKKFIIPCLAGILILILFFLFFRRKSSNIHLEHFEVSGKILGEETSKILSGRGRVLIIAQPIKSAKLKPFQLQQKALISALKKGGIHVSAIKNPPEPERMIDGSEEAGVPYDFLKEEIEKESTLSAVISLCGPPLLPENFSKGVDFPRILIFSPLDTDIQKWLENGVIQLAIIPKPQLDSPPSQPNTPQEWFERYFVIQRSSP